MRAFTLLFLTMLLWSAIRAQEPSDANVEDREWEHAISREQFASGSDLRLEELKAIITITIQMRGYLAEWLDVYTDVGRRSMQRGELPPDHWVRAGDGLAALSNFSTTLEDILVLATSTLNHWDAVKNMSTMEKLRHYREALRAYTKPSTVEDPIQVSVPDDFTEL